MNIKNINRALKPLRRKLHFEKTMRLLLYMLLAAGLAALILAFVSLFVVIPFVRIKILQILVSASLVAVASVLVLVPTHKRVITTADSLGLKERVITAWYLKDDNSPVSILQRRDTENALKRINLKKAYKIKIPKELVIAATVIITSAFLISLIPGKVSRQTQLRESLINEIEKQEDMLEEELEKQTEKHSGMSDEQLKKLKEALEKLREDFNKAKSEEDALKALAQMENLLEKLKGQNPLKDMKTLENTLAGSSLTEDMSNALKNEDEEALKEALEQLKEELEKQESMEEISELLKQAAENMGNNSMMAEALDKIASSAANSAASGGSKAGDVTQALNELIAQANENAIGEQDFIQAAGELGKAAKQAKLSVSSVDRNVAQGNGGNNGAQQGSQGQGNQPGGQGNQPGGQGNQSGGQSNQPGGQGNQPSNEGQNGQSGQSGGQSQGGGAGAGSGSTNEDAGYNEGDPAGGGRAPGDRKETEYQSIYVPEHLGGEGNESVISGQKLQSGSSTFNEADGAPVQKGVMLPWNEVISEYREEAVQSMDRQEIPAGMEMLVRDYFSSLE